MNSRFVVVLICFFCLSSLIVSCEEGEKNNVVVKDRNQHIQPSGTKPAAPYDMSGFSLPVVRSFLSDTNQIQSDSQSSNSNTADDDRTMKSILPLMMMMSQRKHSYKGMGYLGGAYGLGPSPYLSAPMSYANQLAMSYPLQQAHLLNSNPFLDPSRNPFLGGLNPMGLMV